MSEPPHIADAERPVGEIGHRGPDRRRRDDRQPVDGRTEALHRDLDDHGGDENGHEDACADQVSAIVSVLIGVQERHCHRIPASLAKRRRQKS